MKILFVAPQTTVFCIIKKVVQTCWYQKMYTLGDLGSLPRSGELKLEEATLASDIFMQWKQNK